MIPVAKHLNFYDESIGSIHVLRLTREALQRIVLECPLPQFTDRGASLFTAPLYEKMHKNMIKSGKIGREVDWYE